jgi:hypothetical protein
MKVYLKSAVYGVLSKHNVVVMGTPEKVKYADSK